MNVWVWPEKVYLPLGARRFEVEWHTVTPKASARIAANELAGEQDEVDPDCDLAWHAKYFPPDAKRKAVAYAKRIAPRSAYGSAAVTEQAVDWYVEEDRIAEWTNIGEPEYWP